MVGRDVVLKRRSPPSNRLTLFPPEVHDEASQDAPVEERPRGDEGVGQAAGGCFFLKRILDSDFILEDREYPRFLRKGISPELGRNEALDMGFSRGFHEKKLLVNRGRGEGRDPGVLAFKGVGE